MRARRHPSGRPPFPPACLAPVQMSGAAEASGDKKTESGGLVGAVMGFNLFPDFVQEADLKDA